jgi:hypothetical protein
MMAAHTVTGTPSKRYNPRYLGLVAVQGPVCSIELTKAIR